MAKIGSKIFDKTEGIKPRERTEPVATRIKTAPGMFLDTHHRATMAEAENALLRNRRVKIADLKIIEGRKRQLSATEFAELKANLEAFPLVNPVAVRALPGGTFELISGHNRVQAFIELGRDEIDAYLVDLGDEQIVPAAFYSNLLSPSLPDYEKYLGFKNLQDATGKTQTELARESGLAKSMISMLFAFDDMSPAAHALLSSQPHLVSATLAAKLRSLPRAEEAIAGLAAGDMSAQQALAFATGKPEKRPAVPRSGPVIIRNGKSRFAEISMRGTTAVIKMADEGQMSELMTRIETMIREHMLPRKIR